MACEEELCSQTIFMNDEGLPIQFWVHTCDTSVCPSVEAVLDIQDATLMEVNFLKPDGTYSATLAGSFFTDGSDGIVEYITLADTLDQSGTWKGQLEVTRPSGKKSTTVISFKVSNKL